MALLDRRTYKIERSLTGMYYVYKNYGIIFSDWTKIGIGSTSLEAAENNVKMIKDFDNYPKVVKEYYD